MDRNQAKEFYPILQAYAEGKVIECRTKPSTVKGNKDWLCSAPHGAGRLMSRTQAKKELSMDSYKNEMKGIYSTSVCEETIDEAPMAYKPTEEIVELIKHTVDVIDVIKPIYNFKAKL